LSVAIVRVLGKRRAETMSADELRARRDAARHTYVDVGTGDGKHALAVASTHADWLVIGLDAIDGPMAEVARRAARKPGRGGCPNLVLLRASVEAVPAELHGVADDVAVLLPWGRLLEGVVHGDPGVVGGIAALARPGGSVRIVLNGEIWDASTPSKYAELPPPTPAHVEAVVVPAFARAGVALGPPRWLGVLEAKALRTTWARRLGHHRSHPRFLEIAGTRAGGEPGGST
jgi:16S rRNA (adenine(1408)-N(1))-methyltransferase